MALKFVLADMPIPPSSNNMHVTRAFKCKRTGQIRNYRHPSEEMDLFVKAFLAWQTANKVLVEKARKFVLDECLMKGMMVRADWYFCFPGTKIWTLDGRPKRLDTKNRVKPIQDSLADAIRVDDCHFWSGYDEKQETMKEARVYAVLRPFKPRSVSEVKLEDL